MDLFFQMGLALLRKSLFAGLLLAVYLYIDRRMLNRFDTAEVLQHDPKAIAILLGLLSLSVALS
jgi:hypothetical protein